VQHCVDYQLGPSLRLRICGGRGPLRHFAAEYAGAEARSPGEADVEIRFTGDEGPGPAARGGYKTVSWRVALADPADGRLHAAIALRGRPRSFALSLVQGFFVEPLLSIAAARTETVLLPSAGIEEHGGALVLLGRSRSGKSTLAARALADGRGLLGDDQVLVEPSGLCRPFPRRLRVYGDLRRTAPDTYRRLAAPVRAGLLGRTVVARLTGGYVAPPVRVRPAALGQLNLPGGAPVTRIVLVERSDGSTLEHSPLGIDEAVASALEILGEQRARLHAAGGAAWRGRLEETRRLEAAVLASAWSRTSLSRLRVPRPWAAPDAIRLLARELGLDRTT
jgi:hypothetical protein